MTSAVPSLNERGYEGLEKREKREESRRKITSSHFLSLAETDQLPKLKSKRPNGYTKEEWAPAGDKVGTSHPGLGLPAILQV